MNENEFTLPVDVAFDGKRFYDFEFPYKNLGRELLRNDPLLTLTDCFVALPDYEERTTVTKEGDNSIRFGGSPSNGAMGFVLMLDVSGSIKWYVSLGDGNPVCEVNVGRTITARTSSGLTIQVQDPYSSRVEFEFEK